MKIAMLGAGGVGGYYGGRLAAAGHEVTFVARGAHGEALQRDGLRVRSELGDLHLKPVRVTAAAGEVGPVDLVVVAVKLWDTETAAEAALPLMSETTMAVSLQNGIEKDEVLAAALGRGRVLGGVTYILATIAEPGVIVHTGGLQRVVLGELAGGRSTRVDAVVSAWRAAGIDAEATDDVRRATWEKFLFLASNAAITAATRRTIGEVREHPATRSLLRDLMLEGAALARAEGVSIPNDFVEDRLRFTDTLPAGGRASMAHDLLRGHRLELEWLSGAIVRRAAPRGLSVPMHRALYSALVLAAQGA